MRGEETYRQLVILKNLPKHPWTIPTSDIQAYLAGEDISVSIRTVQRDLEALSLLFPITSEDDGSGFRWALTVDLA